VQVPGSTGLRPLTVALLAGAGVALLVLAFWAAIPDRYFEITLVDYRTNYEPAARSLLAGRGLVAADGSPAVAYPPGHSIALAASFALGAVLGLGDDAAIRGLILLCWAVTGGLLFLLAESVWGRCRAWFATALFATYPPALWMSLQPTSEVTFLPLLAAAALLTWRTLSAEGKGYGLSVAAGLCTGAAMLVRPAAIALPVVFAVMLVAADRARDRRRGGARAALLLTAVMLVVTPWQILLWRTTGELKPLSASGPLSVYDGLTFAVNAKDYRAPLYPPRDAAAFMHAVNDRWRNGRRDVAAMVAEAARENPVGAVQVGVWKAVRAWYGTDSQRLDAWLLLMQLPYLGLLGWATIRCFRCGGSGEVLATLMLAMVLYFWLMTMAVLPILRYMAPVICLWFTVVPSLLQSRK
jgi:4-amino-4-deoxy-L-arabinose transferase-like glycosyltransferase